MNKAEKDYGYKHEVLQSLSPVVEENLKYLKDTSKRRWWPNEYFLFMQHDGYESRLRELRDEAKGLSNASLVVLVGNEITEEALPNYSSRLSSMFPDKTGVSKEPWSRWNRGWTSEEKAHGMVLDHYLLLTGRVDMSAVERSTLSLLENGFKQSPDPYQGLLYPMFQEVATRVSHLNLANRAREQGVKTLYDICANIAGDEHRHSIFYEKAATALFCQDPKEAVIQFHNLMRRGIVMPARLMTDEINPKPPTLFQNFAEVAMAEGVYTANDYATILRDLNGRLGIGNLSLSGKSAEVQEKLMNMPGIISKKEVLPRDKLIEFDWIHGQSA